MQTVGQIPPLQQASISKAKDPGFYLAECEHSLLGSHHTSFEHDEVIGYLTIMDKATQWVDALVRKVIVGRCIVLDQLAIFDKVALTNLVKLFVDFCPMMVAFLPNPSHREGHSGRVPSANTGNLAQPSMGLLGCINTLQ